MNVALFCLKLSKMDWYCFFVFWTDDFATRLGNSISDKRLVYDWPLYVAEGSDVKAEWDVKFIANKGKS